MTKIKRDAFLYLEPRKNSYGEPSEYSQCVSCPLWTGEKHETCFIHGKDLKVKAGDYCGLYVNGEPLPELAGKEKPYVTKEESGFGRRQIRCQNCYYFNPTISACKLFFILDQEFPDDFELGASVSQYGCCNANLPKNAAPKKKDAMLRYLGKTLNKKISFKELFS